MVTAIVGSYLLICGVVFVGDAIRTRKIYLWRDVAEAAVGGMLFVLGAAILLVEL